MLQHLETEAEVEALADVEVEEIALPRLDARRAVGRVDIDRDFARDPVEPFEIRAVVGADVDDALRLPADDPRQEEDVLEIERVRAPVPVGAALRGGVRRR